jgi:hypothetical protein
LLFVVSVSGGSLEYLHWKKLSPLDEASSGRPFFFHYLDIGETKVRVAISVDRKTLICGIGASDRSNKHPVWSDNDCDTNLYKILKKIIIPG